MYKKLLSRAAALLCAASVALAGAAATPVPAVATGAATFAAAAVTAGGLTVRAAASKGLYQPGERVVIEATVRNTGSSPVTIMTRNSCDPGVRALLVLKDESFAPLVQAGMENMFCAQVIGFRTLRPAESFRVSFYWAPQRVEPGLYTIRVAAESEEGAPVQADLFVRIGGFGDMETHWAGYVVTQAAERGMIAGYPDGTFRPEASISRAEFIKTLAAARGLKPEGGGPHWASGWVAAAYEAGIITRLNLNLDEPVSRLEIAEMLVRSTGIFRPVPLPQESSFIDTASLSREHRFFAEMARLLGVTRGYPDGSFGPSRQANRAEALVMIVRLDDYLAPQPDPAFTVALGDGTPIGTRVLAGTAYHPPLVEALSVAAEIGLALTERPDGSFLLSSDAVNLRITPGSAVAGDLFLGRPAELRDGRLYVTPLAFEEFGIFLLLTRQE
jgi:hypothetical protein